MCGLFGVYCYGKGKSQTTIKTLVESLSVGAAVRGTHATGISYLNSKREMVIDKAPESAYKFSGCSKIPFGTRVVMGHTRHTTQGSEKKNYNNHPFLGVPNKREVFALAHNGVLDNDMELKVLYNLPEQKVETDSYVAVQLVEHKKKINMESVRWMGEQVEGMFTFTILDHKNQLYVVKNDSPMNIIHFPKLEMYVYASTLEILHNALLSFPETKKIILEILQGKRTAVDELNYLEPQAGQIFLFKQDGTVVLDAFKPQDRVSKYQNRWLKQQAYGGYNSYANWGDEDDGYYTSKNTRALPPAVRSAVSSVADRTSVVHGTVTTDSDNEWYTEYIKSYASSLGHDPVDIDRLITARVSFDTIEDALYKDGLVDLIRAHSSSITVVE